MVVTLALAVVGPEAHSTLWASRKASDGSLGGQTLMIAQVLPYYGDPGQ